MKILNMSPASSQNILTPAASFVQDCWFTTRTRTRSLATLAGRSGHFGLGHLRYFFTRLPTYKKPSFEMESMKQLKCTILLWLFQTFVLMFMSGWCQVESVFFLMELESIFACTAFLKHKSRNNAVFKLTATF